MVLLTVSISLGTTTEGLGAKLVMVLLTVWVFLGAIGGGLGGLVM